MFTSAIASLIGSLVFIDDIKLHFLRTMESTPLQISPFGISIPSQWIWIVGNNVTQLICIKGVYALSARHTALAVNITLSVRKFCTVVISVIYFSNPWTELHTLACLFVFCGAFCYASGDKILAARAKKRDDKQE